MAQHSSNNKPPIKPLASKTLHRTLQELESALSDWDKITETPTTEAAPTASMKPTSTATDEMRERTKKLLAELRKQLSEFSE